MLAALLLPLCAKAEEPEKKAPPRKTAPAPAAPDATMTLRNLSGQEIQAKLLSANGESVTIERVDDGRQFVVELASLDEFSGERVRQWIQYSPEAVDCHFAVSVEKIQLDSATFMTGGRDLKNAEWCYRVKLTSLSRNPISDAKLEYRIVYDDEVEIARTVVAPGKGPNQQDGQLVDLPEMIYNDEIEFETAPVVLHTYEYVPSRGDREYSRDLIKGIWVRVLKGGEVVYEFQSQPSTMASLSWDNEEKGEIRVTNRFRDQFAAGEK